MTKTFAIAALAAFVLAAGAPAFAADFGDQARVQYSDLNLSTPQGAKAMVGRIHAAAKAVCGEEPANTDLNGQHDWKACVSTTETNALKSLNAPLVVMAYNNDTTKVAVAQIGR